MADEGILVLFVDNINGFRVRGLERDSLTNPGPVGTATVEVRVQTPAGVDVPLQTATWPLTLPLVPGSQNDYEGFLAAGEMQLTDWADYLVVFTYNDPAFGFSGPYRYPAVARRLFQ